jgi:phosphate transport system substrate-binding protein
MNQPGLRHGRRTRFSRARVAAISAAVGILGAPATAGAVTLTGSGSSAAQPYMLALFRAYSHVHKSIRFKYVPDGGNAGVKDVQAGRVQFAINTRPPLASDAGTTYSKLFLDGLCIAVHASGNSVSNVSSTTLKDIFRGIDTNWSQVPGSNLKTTIDPIGRNATAGSYTFFQQAVLGGATQSSNVLQVTSDGLVQTGIENDPNSIGYVGLAHSKAGVKKLTVNGVQCDAAHVRSETYPLYRYIWGVVPSNGTNAQVAQFLRWVAYSATAGQIINQAGAVAAFNAAPTKHRKRR